MFYFTALCALALGAHAHGKHQHVPFDAIFGTNFLASVITPVQYINAYLW